MKSCGEQTSRLVYPALTDLATFIMVLGIGLPVAFLFSKILGLHPPSIIFPNKKREAWLCVLVFTAVVAGAFGIYGFYDKVWIRLTLTADPLYVVRDVIAFAVILLPVVVALKWSKQPLGSIAVTPKDLKKSFAFGILTSLMLILVVGVLSPFLGGGFAGFSVSSGYLLLSYVIIGFGEEIIFRGFIQTRLVSIRGPVVGVGVGSLCYVVYNFPLGYFCFSGDIPLAAVYAVWRFSTGLLYGYTFHKSQNVLSSAIVHIVLVYGGLLFRLYL